MEASEETCVWCGTAIAVGDGFRAYEPAGARRAAFCRLEHVVPWVIRGDRWEADPAGGEVEATGPSGGGGRTGGATGTIERCSHCDAELCEVRVVLIRHRGEHRIPDGFCNVEHLGEWAKAGGRWRIG